MMKRRNLHLITLITILCLLGWSNAAQAADIYWNPNAANDNGNGTTEAQAVKYFATAKSLVTSADDWIILCNTYSITGATTLDGSKGSYNVRVKRKTTTSGSTITAAANYMIFIKDPGRTGYTVTLRNITISGAVPFSILERPFPYTLSNFNAIIYFDDDAGLTTLNVETGTVLCNSWSTYGGAIKMYRGGTVNMTGGTIQNCGTDQTGGAIYLSAYDWKTTPTAITSEAEFNMSGGTITQCYAGQGGGAVSFNNPKNPTNYFGPITFTMSGGATISDCVASKYSTTPLDANYTDVTGGGAVAMFQVKNPDSSNTWRGPFTFTMSGGTISGCYTNCNVAEEQPTNGFGGAIMVNNPDCSYTASVSISGDAKITGCYSEHRDGGAFYMRGLTEFSMDGGTIKDCESKLGQGGGVYIIGTRSSSFSMTGNAVINNCDAKGRGGGVSLSKKITSCVFNGAEIMYCDSQDVGGAVSVVSPSPTPSTDTIVIQLINAKIHNNKARSGGGFDVRGKIIMSADAEIYDNQATHSNGGAINAYYTIFKMNGGKIHGNSAILGGGAFHISRSSFVMTDGEIYENHCDEVGGSIHMSYCSTAGGAPNSGFVALRGGKFHDNVGARGGAINFNTGTVMNIPSTSTIEFYDNQANTGGAISVDGAQLLIAAGSFHDNKALTSIPYMSGEEVYSGKGGVILEITRNASNAMPSLVRVSNGKFYDNEASSMGGCVFVKDVEKATITDPNVLEIQGGEIYDNQVGEAGGAIYFEANTELKMQGTVKIKGNRAGRVPNNVYLLTDEDQTIEVTGTFTPQYVGIFPKTNATISAKSDIPVFEGAQGVISDLNTGIGNYTYKVVDDKQLHRVKYPGSTILYFGIDSPWSPLQQTVRKTADLDPILHNGVYEISNVKQLTAFLWYVNGIDTHDTDFSSVHPGAKGKLMADIDMEDHHWESIANYTGTFDGNGYIISHLSMVPTNPSSGRGMFGTNTSGTIKNVILRDSYMAASTGYVGIVVCQNSGTLSNSVAEGEMVAADDEVIMGGLAGLNGGEIHSSFAIPEMYGYQMGGLVGANTGNLYNSFVNALFSNKGSGYMGGLVGVNTGRVENCYSRVQGDAPASNFGWLVGNNTDGTVNYCYIPDGESTYKATGNAPTGHGTYGTTSTPYLYNHRDNQVTLASGTSPYVSNTAGADKQMLIALNKWVTTQNTTSGEHPTYTYWLRTTTKTINDDLPLLRLPATNAVAATNGSANLDYNQVNDLLTGYTTATKAICLYGAEASMDGNASSAAPLYIDQEATLKQSGSKGAINARTSQMLETYEGEGKERWHHFSSPLTHSDIGFTYNNASPVPFDWGLVNPCGVEINGDDDHSLFPSDLLTKTSFNSVDLFCFYEPEYHWLNLKRASDSHWHMNATEEPIAYNGNGIGASTNGNETYLVPGKGYLVSVDVNQLVQNYGTLNDGNVTLYSVTKTDDNAWAERLGFNLLGNPYQSYLDFEAFKTTNGTSLWASDADIYEYTYAVFDPKLNAYRQYKDGSSVFSNAASRYIHPHQGFFIRMTKGTNSNTTVTYTNDMRVVTLPEDVTSPYRGEAQPAFPLINLMVSDSEGNADLAVLELDRANDEGAEKIRLSECKGMLSLGYENRDYSILFRTKIEDYQPLRFEALEEGTFTLEWNTANGEFSELTLIDNIAGTTTDMLSRDSYSFEANPDQYASRFKIVIGHYKDIDEYEDGPSTGSGTFAFQMGDELVVNGEGSLQMFDVTGRLVMKQTINGTQSAIALPCVAKGVYVLRLTGKTNGTQTQKIVIQ